MGSAANIAAWQVAIDAFNEGDDRPLLELFSPDSVWLTGAGVVGSVAEDRSSLRTDPGTPR